MQLFQRKERISNFFRFKKKYRSIIYFRTPIKIDIFGDNLFRPFTNSVWVCLLVMIFLIGYLLKVAMAWERAKSAKLSVTKINGAKTEKESITVTLLMAFGACCQQGSCTNILMTYALSIIYYSISDDFYFQLLILCQKHFREGVFTFFYSY